MVEILHEIAQLQVAVGYLAAKGIIEIDLYSTLLQAVLDAAGVRLS